MPLEVKLLIISRKHNGFNILNNALFKTVKGESWVGNVCFFRQHTHKPTHTHTPKRTQTEKRTGTQTDDKGHKEHKAHRQPPLEDGTREFSPIFYLLLFYLTFIASLSFEKWEIVELSDGRMFEITWDEWLKLT